MLIQQQLEKAPTRLLIQEPSNRHAFFYRDTVVWRGKALSTSASFAAAARSATIFDIPNIWAKPKVKGLIINASKKNGRMKTVKFQCYLLHGLLEAGLVLIHGGIDKLVDVLFHILKEGSIISFLLPARRHGRVLGNRCLWTFGLFIAGIHLNAETIQRGGLLIDIFQRRCQGNTNMKTNFRHLQLLFTLYQKRSLCHLTYLSATSMNRNEH